VIELCEADSPIGRLNESEYEVFVMSIGLALLASADPVTIQQFSHALQELSILPNVCRQCQPRLIY
jgi:hypothetical protein